MSSGNNVVEIQEAQTFDIVEESGEETEDEHGNAVGHVTGRNGSRALGGVGGRNDNPAASTAVSSAAASTTAVVGNDNDNGSPAIIPTTLFPVSPAVVAGHIATGSAAVGNERIESIDKGKGRADDADITKEDYIFLATNHFNASKALNKLRDEQAQAKLMIEKCKVEKRELDLVAKEIDKRSKAATKRFKHTMDEMCNVKAEQTAAEDKFMQANKAMCDPGEAGASKR